MNKLLLAISLLIIHSTAFAGPSKQLSWMIEDSVSLLDWGLMRAEQSFSGFSIFDTPTSATFGYHYELNRIVVAVHPTTFTLFETKEKAKSYLSEALNQVKGRLGIDPRTGSLYDNRYTDYFNHNGFRRTSRPPKLDREILSITKIIGKAFYTTKDERKLFECTTDLLSNKIFCGE